MKKEKTKCEHIYKDKIGSVEVIMTDDSIQHMKVDLGLKVCVRCKKVIGK